MSGCKESLFRLRRSSSSKKSLRDPGCNTGRDPLRRRGLAAEIAGLPECNASAACAAVGISRAMYYRVTRPPVEPKTEALASRRTSRRALTTEEREGVAQVLNEDRFADKSPPTIYATLLDEGIYLCSIRTMYRILKERDEVRERRKQLHHPVYKKPELIATGPNQVWSWDITKLRGPQKHCHYHL